MPMRIPPRVLLLMVLLVIQLGAVCCSGKLEAQAVINGLISNIETGAPINNAAVSVCGRTAESNAEGQFKLAEIPPGKQAFEIEAEAFQLLSCQVLLKSGKNDLAFNLNPIADPIIAGVVSDLFTGAVLTGATVELNRDGEVIGICSTDEQGCFAFSQLQVGTYQLMVSHILYENRTMELHIAPGTNAVAAGMVRKGLSGQVAFSFVRQGKRDIAILSLASGEVCQVTADGVGNFRPSLSVDGSMILWAHEQNDVKQIYLGTVNANGGTGMDAVAVSAGPSDDYPVWAPDGSMFACQAVRAGTNRIIVMDLNGTELADLGAGRFPTWSLDGRKIAFITAGKITVADWQGGEVVTIGDRTNVYYPAWSPDGKMVAYSVKEGDAAYILYIYDIESNTSRKLITGKAHLRSSFAPDGQWIAFHTILPEISSVAQVYALDVNEPDGSVLRLSLENGEHRDPGWSR